jgi:CubicO group peptidase (beta-lactamase class C family)
VTRRDLLALLGSAAVAWPGTVLAQQPAGARPEAFTQVLVAWAAKHRIRAATIIVRRQGQIVHQAGLGGADPNAPVLLASLSKAITGACIATLVRDGKLSFETPVSKALAKFIAAHGKPADPRLERVTIGQLLTHRAGFSSNEDGEDPATHSVLDAYLATHSSREPPKPEYTRLMLATPLVREPGSAFAYSNGDYLLLGAIIEETTDRNYEEFCRAAVLTPAGANGALDPEWPVLWSHGGWRMSGADYLAFYETFGPHSTVLGKRAVDWMLNRSGKTYGKATYPAWYGLGVRLRDRGKGVEIWHTGSLARRFPPDAVGQRTVNTSTLAFRAADGTSWFVHSTPLVTGNARNELNNELLLAYQSIKRWH